MLKSSRTRKGQRFEFRIEAKNALNSPVFGDPATSFGATDLGQIGSAKLRPRKIQPGMRYSF